MNYKAAFEIAEVTIRNQPHKFFRDGAARRAALAAVHAAEMCGTQEVIIDAMCRSLDQDGHVCYFDDPCDEMRAA